MAASTKSASMASVGARSIPTNRMLTFNSRSNAVKMATGLSIHPCSGTKACPTWNVCSMTVAW
ncbi:hypothetical protein D3C78_661440 [compost metagenome]